MKKIHSTDYLNEGLIEIRPVSPFIDRSLLDEKPHRHPFQEILFIQSGKGKHTIDGEVFRLNANTIYVIGEGQIHEFLEGSHLKGFLLRYKDTFLPSELTKFTSNYALFQTISDSNAIKLSKAEAETFSSNFQQMVEEFRDGQSIESNQIFHFLLLTLLSRIDKKIRETSMNSIRGTSSDINLIYQQFMILIEDNYKEQHGINFYATKLNVNPRRLAQITTQLAGKTPKQLINRRIIREAQRLLKFTNLNFKEICYELGFKEPAYFSRIFKLKTGTSPKTFRQNQVMS